MYFRILTAYFFILLLLSSISSSGQKLAFENFSPSNGLPASQLISITQDNKNNLYIGTFNDGLLKYNGKSFIKITEKDGLPSNNVYSLKAINDIIYIGTDNGLATLTSSNISIDTSLIKFRGQLIYDINFDSQSNIIWLSTGSGVYFLEKNGIKKCEINPVLDQSIVFKSYIDSQKSIWFASVYNGLFKFSNGKVKQYSKNEGLICQAIYDVLEVGCDTLWIFTENSIYELASDKIKKIDNQIDAPGKEPFYYSATIDKNKKIIWIGTDKGLLKYENKKFEKISKVNGLENNIDIWKIFQDSELNFWYLSKESGMSKLPSLNINKAIVKGNNENDFVITNIKKRDGRIYANSLNELFQVDNITLINKNANPFKHLYLIYDFDYIPSSDTWYYLSDKEIVIKNKIKTYTISSDETEGMGIPKSLFIDKNKKLWIGSQYGVFSHESEKLQRFNAFNEKVSINTFIENDAEQLWVGTEKGVYTLDTKKQTSTFFDQLPKKIVNTFHKDKLENIYVGTEAGLFVYKNDTKKVVKYGQADGLSSNNISSVGVDKDNRIWVGTSIGLDRLTIQNDSVIAVKNYNKYNGFTGESCSRNGMYIDENNHVYVTTQKGLYIIKPEYDFTNMVEPVTQLTSIFINGDNAAYQIFSDSVLAKKREAKLTLKYTENNLVFHFFGTSLTAPDLVHYQYMLKGFDKKWQSTSETQIPYPNLKPGTYTFLVKACNNDGIWNKEPVEFNFIITPPFYATWWFYSICIAIGLMGVYSYYKIRRANKKILKQRSIIEDKNTELEKANSAIAQVNKNITDSINYAKRIQDAILPAQKNIGKYVYDFFILYKPKDIVSGDFYWFEHFNNKSLIAAVDCTGHGVPGALVSMVGHNNLTRVINEFKETQPNLVLNKLNELVADTLTHNNKTAVKDGMDMSLIMIDHAKQQLHFSGANNAVYILRKKEEKLIGNSVEISPILNNSNYNFYEIKADKQAIGGDSENSKLFTNHVFDIKEGDIIYLFTDGYADQFGGPKGKKFLYKPLKELLLTICEQPMKDQRKQLSKVFSDWKGNLEQVDDVCVIGIRI